MTPRSRPSLARLLTPKEHSEQVMFFQMVDANPGTTALPIFAIPNVGTKSKVRGAMMKREGLRAGYPDIGVDVAVGEYHGLRIEMKRRDRALSRVSPEQHQWHDKLRRNGFAVVVCYGADAAWDTLWTYLFGNFDTMAHDAPPRKEKAE